MEQINYNRRHDIKINSLQTREINLLLSFVWYESINGEVWKEIEGLDINEHGMYAYPDFAPNE